MAKAQKIIDFFEGEIEKYNRRLEMIHDFETDRESFYEVTGRQYGTPCTILVKVTGYLTEGVSFKFYAGNGALAREMHSPVYRSVNISYLISKIA